MSERKFDLGDYVEVKDRIAILYELYPNARLVTDEVVMLTAPDDKQRVMVKALAYRTPDDPHPAVGYSWMELPGTTSYTRGSELENTETSAWGRAIAALGILIDKSIASGQEVANKAGGEKLPEVRSGAETVEILGRIRKSGTIAKGGSDRYQCEFFQTPEGHAIGFKFKLDGDDKDIPQVVFQGDLGEALWLAVGGDAAELLGKRVTIKGLLHNVRQEGRRGFYRLVGMEIEHPDFTLPASEPPVGVEDRSRAAPLFDDSEQATIDAAIGAAS